MGKLMLRGTPIYANSGGEKIALVPEIRLSRKRLGKRFSNRALTSLDPSALYLIDQHGVKRLTVGPPKKHPLRLMAVSFLLAPLLSLLARRRQPNG
ncbi:MAG TPA: hypothetical protein VGE04_10440 [Chloroflexia bacterium]|jgi:hypothetical protein